MTAIPVPTQDFMAPQKVGMLAFLTSEVAFFSTLIVTYAYFIGKSTSGPTPADSLSVPLVCGTTLCLLISSVTVHFADHALRNGHRSTFLLFWLATIGLGILFLLGTAYEWYGLIWGKGLTISTNMFGTTFYTLVGFHAAHVTGGVVMLSVILGLVLARQVSQEHGLGAQMVSWYWHFVDGVWVVVFILVYLIGR
jgi:cytochrome c oxidase subunit 3/cytochrome o ubiquinol oxidase subunit 3